MKFGRDRRVNQKDRIGFANSQTEKLFGSRRIERTIQSIEAIVPEQFRDKPRRHGSSLRGSPQLRPMGVGLELHGTQERIGPPGRNQHKTSSERSWPVSVQRHRREASATIDGQLTFIGSARPCVNGASAK
jgi:hypothetical protein